MSATMKATPWKRADRLAELLALPRVWHRRIERGLRQTHGHGADGDAAAVEGLEEDLPAFARSPSICVGGHPAVLEEQLAGGAGVEAQLLLEPPDDEAGRVRLDDEGADLR